MKRKLIICRILIIYNMLNISKGTQWCYSCSSGIEDYNFKGNCSLDLKKPQHIKKVRCDGPCITILFFHTDSEDVSSNGVKLKRDCYIDYHLQTFHDSLEDSCTDDQAFRLLHPRMFSPLEYRKLISDSPDSTISCVCHKDLCNVDIDNDKYDLSNLRTSLELFNNLNIGKTVKSENNVKKNITKEIKYSNVSSFFDTASSNREINATKQFDFNNLRKSENARKSQEETEMEHFAITVNKFMPLMGLIIVHHITEVIYQVMVYSLFALVCICIMIWMGYICSCFKSYAY